MQHVKDLVEGILASVAYRRAIDEQHGHAMNAAAEFNAALKDLERIAHTLMPLLPRGTPEADPLTSLAMQSLNLAATLLGSTWTVRNRRGKLIVIFDRVREGEEAPVCPDCGGRHG